MKLLYVLYTYNRRNMLLNCWQTMFGKNKLRPDRILWIDDGSNLDTRQSAFFAQMNDENLPIDVFSLGKNIGYGRCAQFAFNMVETYNPEYVYFIESDYIFTQNGLDIVSELFDNNEFAKEAVGFSGYDNPDFYDKQKTDITFPQIIVNDCGEDNLNRNILFKPFEQETSFGKVQLEFVSNSCGTMYFNWKKIQTLKTYYPDLYKKWVSVVTEAHKERGLLNDGMMSHGISWIWNKFAISQGIDRNKYAALLNIKPSVANHINGAGINGSIVPEGKTFVGSPSFRD